MLKSLDRTLAFLVRINHTNSALPGPALGLRVRRGQAAQPGQTKTLVDGNTAFACDLYAQLWNTPGNLFFSPYSVSTALAMTYAGARGDTETQMAQVLHFGRSQAPLHSTFGALQRQLDQANQQQGIELSLANALCP